MIAFLTGRVAGKGTTHLLLDVGGVGFRLALSAASAAALPAVGDIVTVHTYLHVREDELSLFGFENETEKALFEKLITVNGVGPKVALAALSSFSPSTLADAIAREDVALISEIPGVGVKTAKRIILDLKDRLDAIGIESKTPREDTGSSAVEVEVREALLAMGFSSAEIVAAMKGFAGDALDTQAQLKHALRRLGGGA